jgi:exonuclease III
LKNRTDLRLLSWNIRHGGGHRAEAIAAAIAAHAPDIAILCEYREGPSSAIGARLSALDYRRISAPHAGEGNNLAVFAQTAAHVEPVSNLRLAHRWATVRLLDCDLTVVALHVPGSGDAKTGGLPKRDFWGEVLRFAEGQAANPCVVIGDLNTGLPRLDEQGSTFSCVAQFRQLSTIGFVDAWRERNGAAREFSWYSAHGNGFRLDHAFVSPPLRPHIASCRYSHDEREAGISDHSSLILELSPWS